MGKIRAQRLGKGTRRKVPSHRFKGDVRYNSLKSTKTLVKGKVVDIFQDAGRTAPLAKVRYEDGQTTNLIAPTSLSVGDEIAAGTGAPNSPGCSTYISEIPEGSLVSNVEAVPGDGGKFARSSGTSVRIVTHDPNGTVIQMPSGSFKTIDPKCRATFGTVAGAGRLEKPFVKAGNKHKARMARGRLHPIVCGVSMNACDHPFGGGNHPHTGKPKSVSRHTPPGRKVGSISPKRTGKKK
jgi:large subunit ribosomal protein L2